MELLLSENCIFPYQGAFVHLDEMPKTTETASGEFVISSLGPTLPRKNISTNLIPIKELISPHELSVFFKHLFSQHVIPKVLSNSHHMGNFAKLRREWTWEVAKSVEECTVDQNAGSQRRQIGTSCHYRKFPS
jgi:hypothetical protein